jgi:hypothetical protein
MTVAAANASTYCRRTRLGLTAGTCLVALIPAHESMAAPPCDDPMSCMVSFFKQEPAKPAERGVRHGPAESGKSASSARLAPHGSLPQRLGLRPSLDR